MNTYLFVLHTDPATAGSITDKKFWSQVKISNHIQIKMYTFELCMDTYERECS